MDFDDYDMYNTPQNQLEVETIDEEAECEEEEQVIVPGDERHNLNQDLEEEQEPDEGDPYVRSDEVGVDEYDTLDDIDQDGMNPRYWMGAHTPESILSRNRNTQSRFRESMRCQSLSLRGTGSRAPPP